MKKSFITWGIIGILFVVVALAIILFYYVFYPLKHKDIILKYSQVYNLKPEFVCAVINTESSFDKTAVSKTGARGLMQLMPLTAAEISEKLGVSNYAPEMLFSPDINVRFGCFYLSYLLEVYNGNTANVLCAYNAGLTNVNKWLENQEYVKNGTLTTTPFKETNNYVKKVNSAINIYKSRIN